jgi:hypothetical protein
MGAEAGFTLMEHVLAYLDDLENDGVEWIPAY